jgi:hypothetical protein
MWRDTSNLLDRFQLQAAEGYNQTHRGLKLSFKPYPMSQSRGDNPPPMGELAGVYCGNPIKSYVWNELVGMRRVSGEHSQ